jgi:hypothetical protein
MEAQAIIVGAQRCGTTRIAVTLGQHSEVRLATPLRPEPKFFMTPRSAIDAEEYIASFYSGEPRRLRLEKSTSYLDSDVAVASVRAVYPDARILVVTRDPVERALSHYAFSVRNGLERRDPETALFAVDQTMMVPGVSVPPFAYIDRGRFADGLARWRPAFPSIHVVVLEALLASASARESLLSFLDLGVDFAWPDLASKINSSHEQRPAETDHLRRRLAAEFRPATLRLQEMIDIDLSRWWPWLGDGA